MQWRDNDHAVSCRMAALGILLDQQWHLNTELCGPDSDCGLDGTRRLREVRKVIQRRRWGDVQMQRTKDPASRKRFVYRYRLDLAPDAPPIPEIMDAVRKMDTDGDQVRLAFAQ